MKEEKTNERYKVQNFEEAKELGKSMEVMETNKELRKKRKKTRPKTRYRVKIKRVV